MGLRRRSLQLQLLAFCCVLTSCSDGGDNADVDATTSRDGAGGTCPTSLGGSADPIFGQTSSRFQVSAAPAWVIFDGAVYDGQRIKFHVESQRQGQCRLLTYTSSLCTPACGAGHACVDSECVPFPTVQSVGTVVLAGVGSDAMVDANGTGQYYWFTDGTGVDELTTVSVSAPGDVGPAFELSACATASPLPTTNWDQLLADRADGQDVTLQWSNPIDTARVYLRMTTGIGTHGGISPFEIECEGRDTGSLTLPGSYLDALYSTGWSCGECGNNDLFRYHATETTIGDYTVQLRSQSSVSFWHIPR